MDPPAGGAMRNPLCWPLSLFKGFPPALSAGSKTAGRSSFGQADKRMWFYYVSDYDTLKISRSGNNLPNNQKSCGVPF